MSGGSARQRHVEADIAAFAAQRCVVDFIRYSEAASLVLLVLGEPEHGGSIRPQHLRCRIKAFVFDLRLHAVRSKTRDDENSAPVDVLPDILAHFAKVRVTPEFIDSCMRPRVAAAAALRAPRVDAVAARTSFMPGVTALKECK